MLKVVYSVRKAGRQTKETGVGYIDSKSLCIPKVSKNGKPYIKVFEDCIKRPITEGEYSTTYYEFVTVEHEVENASKTDKVGIETREICITYYIWFKILPNEEKEIKNEITEFRDDYFFLSNFYDAEIEYEGNKFQNNESAFQAAKCPERVAEFLNLSGAEAKRLGKQVKLRSDWETVKEKIMYEICLAKFTQHPELKDLLLNTKNTKLIEGNTWNDTYWGVCNNVGENKLGKILMLVREELKK